MTHAVGRTRRRTRQRSHGVWHAIGVGLSAGFLALVVLLALVVIIIPKVAGATPMTVLTSSMEPKLPPGTLIVVKPEPLDTIRVGDVMTYQIRSGDPAVISHRVISISSTSDGSLNFTTKGDNNSEADPTVIPQQVRGVLWYSLPLLGYVNSALSGEQRLWLVPMIAGALLVYALYMVVSATVGAVRRRRARRSSTAIRPPGRR